MNQIKITILNWIVKNLFNGITDDDILHHDGQTLYLGKKPLSQRDVKEIVTGAKVIQEMYAWQLISKELKQIANQTMYEKSKSVDDMVFGKVMLLVVDLIEKKLKKLSSLK
jgi:hypothetical protein